MIWLLACALPAECADGYLEQADGTCLAETAEPFGGGSTVEELLDALPPCVPMAAGDRVDVDAGCVDGACASMTYAEIEAALGESASCIGEYDEAFLAKELECRWPRGIVTEFYDLDDDGVPDADLIAYGVYLEPPYDGTTPEGLGLDASFRCFLDAYGAPDTVGLVHDGEHWWPGSFGWPTDAVSVGWRPESGPWDGTPSWMEVYGD